MTLPHRRRFRGPLRWAVLPTLGLLAVAVAACQDKADNRTANAETAATAAPESSAQNGSAPSIAKLFETNCAGCHGVDLKGAQGPSLVDKTWVHGNDDASILKVIKKGAMTAGMPAFEGQFSDAEMRGLVAYIREKGASAPADTAPFPTGTQTSEKQAYKVVPVVAKGLVTPWSMVFLGPDRMLVSERPGRLRVVHTDGTIDAPVANAPRITTEFLHGGMLGLALAPDYAKSGWIYIAFTDERPDRFGEIERCAKRSTCFPLTSQIKVIRAKLRDNVLVEQQTIWQAPDKSYRPTPNFGGRMAFGADGMLYFAVGDRVYSLMEAQDLSSPIGKVHRVAPDGSIPKDNPFAKKSGALASIWSYGHRNPQGFAVDPRTGHLWESEHGPRGGDELNLLHPGYNYGWPLVTLGMGYDGLPFDPAYPIGHSQLAVPMPKGPKPDTSTMVDSVTHWTPSIAVSSIAFYTGNLFPQWRNSLFVTSLQQQEFLRLTITNDKVTGQELLFRWHGRLRDVVNGPDGAIYIAVNEPDMIVKLVPATEKH
jgi:glucose/arabinose dehydrogenase